MFTVVAVALAYAFGFYEGKAVGRWEAIRVIYDARATVLKTAAAAARGN